jgi:hypothetical protein
MSLFCGGFALVGLAIGIVVPIIINIQQGNFVGITTIVILLALICCVIYLLRSSKYKHKKTSKKDK